MSAKAAKSSAQKVEHKEGL